MHKLAILAISILLLGCGNTEANVSEPGESAVQNANEQAVEDTQTEMAQEDAPMLTFEATDTEGTSVTSDIFAESKLTMLNVWATYCNPCLNEMPDLGEIAGSYDASEFQMYGIISDVQEGDAAMLETAKELIVQTGAAYPHLLLNESLYANLLSGVTSVPTTFFVNQEGEVLGYLVGAQSKESWEGIINELLQDVKE